MSDAKVQVTIQLGADTLEKVRRLAMADSRSVSSYLDMLIRNRIMGMPVESSLTSARVAAGRQIDIAEQIARKVKAGPSRHK